MEEFENPDKGWAAIEFEGLSLGDKRLEKRLLKVAEQLSSNLQLPIYAATKEWASAKAAYRLFDNEKVCAEKILAPHRAQTIARILQEELVLAIQDTTYLNFSRGKKSKSLGPIGDSISQAQGMVMHHTVAITPSNLPMGILSQKIWVRDGFNEQTDSEKWKAPIEEKESYKWIEALREVTEIVPRTTRVITVCDREADIYEFLSEAKALNADILIRACSDRNLAEEPEQRLFNKLSTLPVIGVAELSLPRHDRPNCKVTFDIRVGAVTLAPPQRYGVSTLEPLKMFCILASEQSPVNENEKLEWRLMTNIPVLSLDDAIEKILWYRCRWQIEVYHRILKTGCDVEGCLLEERDRITRYLVLFSVIAWRIFWMTHIARVNPNAPASTILSKRELDVLHVFTKENTCFKNNISTAKEVILAIAMLGGFLNRKHDGKPGPTPVWRGWQLLQMLAINLNKERAKAIFATYG